MEQIVKKKRPIIEILKILFILLFLLFIYVITQFTALRDNPIKVYDYALSAHDLEKIIINIVENDSSLHYKITDTTGTINNGGFHYWMDIDFKNAKSDLQFKIRYNDKKHFFNDSPSSELSLKDELDWIDNKNEIGNGGIHDITDIFEDRVIKKIDKIIKHTMP